MRVLVTGASGFIGCHLAAHLAACGDRVVGTYAGARPDSGSGTGLEGVELHAVDVTDGPAMAALVAAVDPEVVIHLAGLSHVGASWQRLDEYFLVNVLGTERLLEAARGRRVVFASSAEVYGVVPESEQPISEARPVAPPSPYAMTKACAERFVLAAGGVVARTFNLVGPGQAPRFALPAFARQLAAIQRGEQVPVLETGNLSARRDFVHVEDGARAYRLLAVEGLSGEVYNVASGHSLSIEEALSRLMRAAGMEVPIEPDPARFRPVDVPLLTGDASRLEALGWKAEKSVDDAVRELWESVVAASAASPCPESPGDPRS